MKKKEAEILNSNVNLNSLLLSNEFHVIKLLIVNDEPFQLMII